MVCDLHTWFFWLLFCNSLNSLVLYINLRLNTFFIYIAVARRFTLISRKNDVPPFFNRAVIKTFALRTQTYITTWLALDRCDILLRLCSAIVCCRQLIWKGERHCVDQNEGKQTICKANTVIILNTKEGVLIIVLYGWRGAGMLGNLIVFDNIKY